MDTREQTLDAIQQYITAQRALLSRTQSDIDRLLKLRKESIENPTEFLSVETNQSSFDLTDVSECAPALPMNVDWSLYALLDPSPLRTLTHNITTTNSHTYPKGPHKIQRSPLSPLQRFVKDARVNILEPVFGVGLGLGSGISTPGATASDVGTVEAGVEGDGQDNIKGGKKKGGLTVVLPAPSQTHQLRARGSNGVFLPTPSSSTSTSMPSTNTPRVSKPRLRRLTTTGRHSRASTADLNTPATPVSSTFTSSAPSPFPLQITTVTSKTQSKSTRARRPSTKFAEGDFVDSTPAKRKRSSGIAKAGEGVSMEPPLPTVLTPATETLPSIKLGKRARRASSPSSFQPPPKIDLTIQAKTKIKPETYKQAWTVSEQHLLERLLDEIPEGEKNRWQKISQAMQGRRTPRQVASRVQKYFEKLKRFGIGE